MLALSRRPGERIVIKLGEDLPAGTRMILSVVRVDRDLVRLAFQVPDSVEVNREEVQIRIDAGEDPRVAIREAGG